MNKNITGKGFEYVDSGHAYYLDGKKMSGVTTVLGVLAKPALIGWAARMAVEYIKESTKVEDGFTESFEEAEWESILDLAKNAHAQKRDKAADRGTDVHALVEEYVKECIEEHSGYPRVGFPDKSDKMFYAFVEWAQDNNIKFIASEKKIFSKKLFCAGTVDLVFEKDGRKYVGDVKTMKKLWDRTPFFQCAGYMLMLEEMGEKFDGSCIINISKETNKLTAYYTENHDRDKECFLAALKLYRNLKDINE